MCVCVCVCVCGGGGGGGGGGLDGGILDCQTPCMGLEAAQFSSSLGAIPLKSLVTTDSQHPFHGWYVLYTGHSTRVCWWRCECRGEGRGCVQVKSGGREIIHHASCYTIRSLYCNQVS